MKVEFLDYMGDDLSVVNDARVSFDKESEFFIERDVTIGGHSWSLPKINERDDRLIDFLARENHFTPFTHSFVKMRETVPIFVARQRFKHTVGFSYNEVSRRYVNTPPEFFYPDVWREKPEKSIKQGSGGPHKDNEFLMKEYENFIEKAAELYRVFDEMNVAPEQSRMLLPQSMYTSYVVTGSLAAWARAYNLRKDSHAQKEIQDLAKMWNEIMQEAFPVAWVKLTK